MYYANDKMINDFITFVPFVLFNVFHWYVNV